MDKTREQWLEAASKMISNDIFSKFNAAMPVYNISCGWPCKGGTAKKNRVIGQCFHPKCSEDKVTEIFISPYISDSCECLAVLVHEMVHACVGVENGHKKPFKHLAVSVGLEGKMTATYAGEGLVKELKTIIKSIGKYPHAKLDLSSIKKQSTRLIKVMCSDCGCICRMSAKAINECGLPTCNYGNEMMES